MGQDMGEADFREVCASRTLRCFRDSAGDVEARGRGGAIYPMGSGRVAVMFMPKRPSKRSWTHWRKAGTDIGMTVMQDGDGEGCMEFDPSNDSHWDLAINISKAKRVRQYAPETLERLRRNAYERLVPGVQR